MESSKCRKCGEAPFFVEHLEKWYCYSCNSYVEDAPVQAPAGEVKTEPEPAVQEQGKDAEPAVLADELKALEKEPPVCDKCGATLETRDGESVCPICSMTSTQEPEAGLAPNEAQEVVDKLVAPAETEAEVEPVEARPEAVAAPAPAPVAPQPAVEPKADRGVRMCPSCGQPLKWIDKYSRYYCYSCKKYAPKDFDSEPKAATPVPVPAGAARAPEAKKCPDCGGELRFIEKYNEYYCNACKKYPFHKKSAPDRPKEEPPARSAVQICTKCGKPLKYIEKYDRHYCYECRTYAPKSLAAAPAKPKEEKKVCPACGEEMKFISQYNEWYCYKCKKYTLRPTKPLLLL